jgi:hypothetical protein
MAHKDELERAAQQMKIICDTRVPVQHGVVDERPAARIHHKTSVDNVGANKQFATRVFIFILMCYCCCCSAKHAHDE